MSYFDKDFDSRKKEFFNSIQFEEPSVVKEKRKNEIKEYCEKELKLFHDDLLLLFHTLSSEILPKEIQNILRIKSDSNDLNGIIYDVFLTCKKYLLEKKLDAILSRYYTDFKHEHEREIDIDDNEIFADSYYIKKIILLEMKISVNNKIDNNHRKNYNFLSKKISELDLVGYKDKVSSLINEIDNNLFQDKEQLKAKLNLENRKLSNPLFKIYINCNTKFKDSFFFYNFSMFYIKFLLRTTNKELKSKPKRFMDHNHSPIASFILIHYAKKSNLFTKADTVLNSLTGVSKSRLSNTNMNGLISNYNDDFESFTCIYHSFINKSNKDCVIFFHYFRIICRCNFFNSLSKSVYINKLFGDFQFKDLYEKSRICHENNHYDTDNDTHEQIQIIENFEYLMKYDIDFSFYEKLYDDPNINIKRDQFNKYLFDFICKFLKEASKYDYYWFPFGIFHYAYLDSAIILILNEINNISVKNETLYEKRFKKIEFPLFNSSNQKFLFAYLMKFPTWYFR